MSQRKIKFSIEGTDQEKGHISLSQFVDFLDTLKRALNSIDRSIGDSSSPALYYRVIDLSHNSPYMVTLQPVLRKRMKSRADEVEALRRPTHLLTELKHVKKTKDFSDTIESETVSHISDLALKGGSETLSIASGRQRVRLDAKFRETVQNLVHQEQVSYGTLVGRLDAVDFHGIGVFYIYPEVGAKKILCKFPIGSKEKVKEALEKNVRVHGFKLFKQNADVPYRMEVKEFEVLEGPETHIRDLRGLFKDEESAPKAGRIREMRDEW